MQAASPRGRMEDRRLAKDSVKENSVKAVALIVSDIQKGPSDIQTSGPHLDAFKRRWRQMFCVLQTDALVMTEEYPRRSIDSVSSGSMSGWQCDTYENS